MVSFQFIFINGFYCFTLIRSLTRLTSWILDISHQWLSYGRVFWDFKYPLMASVKFTAIINSFSLFYIIMSQARLTSCVKVYFPSIVIVQKSLLGFQISINGVTKLLNFNGILTQHIENGLPLVYINENSNYRRKSINGNYERLQF